ncbi:MAG TPA: nucleotidyl transferase AbiEii/AbiGii toxin family protein [Puia sp.]|jgi:hypothetical protein
MIEFLQLPEERRRTFIAQTATETRMTEKAVEKDWWITLALRAIFTLPMAKHFVFKGGTSLSKGWGLIERLSEDIDIALALDTSGKYHYQKDISICLMLQYHSNGKDYLFVFDYHDDLVIFNSESKPTESNFLQIKGHDKGSYTLTKLLSGKKGKKEISGGTAWYNLIPLTSANSVFERPSDNDGLLAINPDDFRLAESLER